MEDINDYKVKREKKQIQNKVLNSRYYSKMIVKFTMMFMFFSNIPYKVIVKNRIPDEIAGIVYVVFGIIIVLSLIGLVRSLILKQKDKELALAYRKKDFEKAYEILLQRRYNATNNEYYINLVDLAGLEFYYKKDKTKTLTIIEEIKEGPSKYYRAVKFIEWQIKKEKDKLNNKRNGL